jgi:hypothetical protein
MQFDADSENSTLPPGVVSREAGIRAQEVTGTKPTEQNTDKQAELVKHAFYEMAGDGKGTGRTKWKASEVKRLATEDQWIHGSRYGHLDVGTTVAVGNLLLRGMSVSAVRKALGITLNTWRTWYEKGTGDDVGTQRPITSAVQDGTYTDVDGSGSAHVDGSGGTTDHGVAQPLPQAPYNVFAFVVDHSQAVMEMRAVDGWVSNFRDWKAAQAYLVARNPDEWNPTSKSTIDTTTKVLHNQDDDMHLKDAVSLLEVADILRRAGALPSTTTTVEVLQVESVDGSTQGTDTGDRSEDPS